MLRRRHIFRYQSTNAPPPLCDSVMVTIGNTPLVRLDRLCSALGINNGNDGSKKNQPTILAKLENTNPGQSKKDRIALEIIQQAKANGQLQEGQPVVELTSGNTGTGLAIACPLLGHPFHAVMSKGNSKERAQMMKMLGAQVVLVPQASTSRKNQVSGEDLALVEIAAQRLCQELGAFRVDQFQRQANADAHYHGTAHEILEQTKGILQIDGFVDFVGTGGSFAGCAKRFKESLGPDNVKCFILEPAGIAPLAKKYDNQYKNHGNNANKNHVIQGGGYDMDHLALIAPLIPLGYVDGFLQVTNAEATNMARLLAKTEGIFGGFSAGANLHGAVEMIRQGNATNVVSLVCDSGSKYYSANLLPDD